MKSSTLSLLAALVCVPSACHSPGDYGHSRTYTALDAEAAAAKQAEDYDPVMATRSPEAWRKKTLSVFGVVLRRDPGKSGMANVTLSVRILESRNLCETNDEDSCRVTVSEREHGRLHALLKLRSEDDIGEHSLGQGSLVRVIGTLSDEVDDKDGAAVLRSTYYRHWPRNFFVTSAARSYMKQ